MRLLSVLFRWFIGDWPLYRHLQTDGCLLTDTCSIQVISENAVLITATVIIRQVFQGLSGIFSHKGAYGALFRVRCMITEHLSKVPLGALDERRTGDIKTVLNEDIEKLELCLAHNIPELVGFATGPVVILFIS